VTKEREKSWAEVCEEVGRELRAEQGRSLPTDDPSTDESLEARRGLTREEILRRADDILRHLQEPELPLDKMPMADQLESWLAGTKLTNAQHKLLKRTRAAAKLRQDCEDIMMDELVRYHRRSKEPDIEIDPKNRASMRGQAATPLQREESIYDRYPGLTRPSDLENERDDRGPELSR